MRGSCLVLFAVLLLCSLGSADLRIPAKVLLKPRKPAENGWRAAPDPKGKIIALRGGTSGRKVAFSQAQYHKWGLQAALTVFNILCWAVPLRVKSFSQNQAVLSLANAFAGGIFLMLSFGHLLPEAVVTMERHSVGQGGVALVYTLVGYAAMLFIEKIAFTSSSVVESTHVNADAITGGFRGDTAGQHPRHPQQQHAGSSAHSAQSAIALCCAMSIHSFFESAALGLAPDAAPTYMMAACIALHQPAESVALLVSFLKSGMRTRSIVLWLVGFSLVSLAGVVTGMLVKGLASGEMEAVVMALTAGTFVYVGATEIANEEFDEHTSTRAERATRFGLFAAGMLGMRLIAVVAADYEAYRAWLQRWLR